jgi:hypothetical protein
MKKQRNRFKAKAKAFTANAIQKFTTIYAGVMRDSTPVIKQKSMSPNEAIVFVAMHADAIISGNDHKAEHTMSMDDIHSAVNLLLMLWKEGKIIPPAEYPYTLEETLADDGGEA